MRINSMHAHAERGRDAYWTPREATASLADMELLPRTIVDPACGSGAILDELATRGHNVEGYDIHDYGWKGTGIQDFLAGPRRECIVSNPPYKLARDFVEKAIRDGSAYHAWLLRLNFLESSRRFKMFKHSPPSRVLVSSKRLPMMHRLGWEGPEAPSNVCYAWFVWDANSKDKARLDWFNWTEHA